jgi:hypothetical protein
MIEVAEDYLCGINIDDRMDVLMKLDGDACLKFSLGTHVIM